MKERNKEILRASGDSSYNRYVKVCERSLVDDNVFHSFKTNSDYTYELEHVPKESAVICLIDLKANYADKLMELNWDLVRSNDIYVKTNRSLFESEFSGIIDSPNQDDYMFSPTTIYYLWVAFKIVSNLKEKSSFSFTEIGCGYGGQCLIVHIVADLYDKSVESYSLIDLFCASKLQQKYIHFIDSKLRKDFKIQCQFVTCLEVKESEVSFDEIDVVISNYCLSEISVEWANIYMEKIIKKSWSGFILWNNKSSMGHVLPDHLSINEFKANDFPNLKIEPSLKDSHNPDHNMFCRLVTF